MHLPEGVQTAMVLGTIGLVLINLVRTYTNYFLRKKLIEAGMVDEASQALLKDNAKIDFFTSLKWGLIALFSGLGLILIELTGHGFDTPFSYGVMMVFISLGFLFYFFFAVVFLKKRDL